MAESGAFEFGPYRLDPEKSVLWRSGRLVPLTPKALDVLRVLVEHRGDVVSKQQLLGTVWPDAVVEEANLSVAVAAIRKALGSQPDGRSYVETVSRRGYRFDAPLHDTGAGPQLGLAVLPFSCLGMESDEHLGVALADALIGRLTEVDGLRVPPTAAVLRYADLAKTPRQAAKELGVDAVLTGTIQRHEGRIRVSVQLTPLPAALRPWADSFEGDWTRLFAAQDELADRVARALSLRLTPERAAAACYEPAAEAYRSYLHGRYFWARFDPASLGKAFACFGEALRIDPRYAAAHAGLADGHLLLGIAGVEPPREAWSLTEECAEKALSLDPDLATAHVSRAFARLFRDRDWAGTRQSLDRAASLAPRQASVHLWRGLFLAAAGDVGAARAAIDRGRDLDPLSGLALALRFQFHQAAGEHDRALALARRAVELRPDVFLGHWILGLANVNAGRLSPGTAALRRAVELSENGPVMIAQLAWALARGGEEREARERLAALDLMSETTFVSPCQRAAVLTALGDVETALERLAEGADQADASAVFLATDPRFARLHVEPRFRALLARVGPPVGATS